MKTKTSLTTVLALCLLAIGTKPKADSSQVTLRENDVVALLGGENLLRVQRAGYLESALSTHFREAKLKFRDLTWEGDTVFVQTTIDERWREDKYGQWQAQLKHVGANVVWAQFGKMESLAGADGLPAFMDAYASLIRQWQSVTPRITLISPIAFEAPQTPLQPDLLAHNADLATYVDAIETLASKHNVGFVNLFQPSLTAIQQGQRFTTNGLHILPSQQSTFNDLFLASAGLKSAQGQPIEALRTAVIDKHRLWFEYWRPANWKCLFGDDGRRIFGHAAGIYPTFREEWRRYPALVEQAERRIQDLLNGTPPANAAQVTPILTGWSQPRDAKADIQKALDDFELPEGSSVNLFASEAQGLINPLALRWDSEGSLYVACTIAYPQHEPGEIPDDFIIKLRDTDHDGVADESYRFAGNLNIPTGIEIAPEGIYVGQGTQLILLKDTDGDHQADVREVVLNGFGNGDTHQTSNSFVWSPGGQLYWCQGDGIESRVETPWGVSRLFQAGVFRWRPDRNQLEGLLDDFMGPGNPWGIAFDDWGQPIVIDGAGGVTHLGPALIPSPYRLRLSTIGRPGGYCGIDVIGSPQWPDGMQGDFIIGDYKPNSVSRFSLRKDGASYDVLWKEPIVTSRDEFFRPVDVKVGPDGAIYVCDWFNTVICHQDDSYRHTLRDKGHGRIWRVAASPTPSSNKNHTLAQQSVPELVSHLGSKDRWLREQSKRQLVTRDRGLVEAALDRWVEGAKSSVPEDRPFHLLQALMMNATLERPNSPLLRQCLQSSDSRVRAFAARTVGRWHDRLDSPLKLLEIVIEDSDPQVRMEAILACGNIPRAASVQVAARALSQPTDRWIDYAFTQTVRFLESHWIPALTAGRLDFAENHQALVEIIRAARSRDLAKAIRTIANNHSLDTKARTGAQVVLAAIGDQSDVLGLLDASAFHNASGYDVTAHTQVIEGIVTADRERPKRSAARLIKKLMENSDAAIQTATMALAAQWNIREVGALIEDIAFDATQPVALRQAATQHLPHTKADCLPTLVSLSRQNGLRDLQQSAIGALTEVNLQQAADIAIQHLASDPGFEFSSLLLRGFLGKAGGAQVLIKALERQTITASLAGQMLDRLIVNGYSDPELTQVLRDLAGYTSEIPDYSEDYVAQLAAEAQAAGDPYAGERVFRSTAANCYSCHKVAGAGAELGPDLSNTGTGIPLPRLIEEVVWPTRHVKEGYALTQITTKAGAIHQGYERKERNGGKSLILDEFNTQERLRIPIQDIHSRTEIGSIMPPTAVSLLTRPQLRDLIAFLTELGAPGPFSTRNRDFIREWEAAPASDDPAATEWTPIIARVSGHVDLTDIHTALNDDAPFWLRTTIDLDSDDDDETLRFNDSKGLRVTLGETTLNIDDRNRIPVPSGKHILTIHVDAKARNQEPIAVRW